MQDAPAIRLIAPNSFLAMKRPAGVRVTIRSTTDAEAITLASNPSSRSAFTAFDQRESPAPASRMPTACSITRVSIPIRRRATAAASPPIPPPIIVARTWSSLTPGLGPAVRNDFLAFRNGQLGPKTGYSEVIHGFDSHKPSGPGSFSLILTKPVTPSTREDCVPARASVSFLPRFCRDGIWRLIAPHSFILSRDPQALPFPSLRDSATPWPIPVVSG